MAIKGYSTFSKAPALLEPYYQIVLGHKLETRWGRLIPLQRCSQYILQPPHLRSRQGHPLNSSINNNVVFFFLSDLKIVYYNNYYNSITMRWTREEKYFASLLIWRQNHTKLCKQNFTGSFNSTITPWKAKFIAGYSNFKPQGQKTTSTRRQNISDLTGSRLQEVLTMWMLWEILLEGVRKSLSENVPKNLVFHVNCRIKSINFYPCHLVWPFWSDMIAFLRLWWKMTWCNMNYRING